MKLIETQGDWIQTRNKIRFFPTRPRMQDVLIEDIAHHLSNLCRWTGACDEFYSIAQHCVLVSQLCLPENALWGLLHDAPEAYINDINRPLKHMSGMKYYRAAELRIMKVIAKKYALPCPSLFEHQMPFDVKLADNRILQTEARDICAPLIDDWKIAEPYPDLIVKPVHPRIARQLFMDRFNELTQPTKEEALALAA